MKKTLTFLILIFLIVCCFQAWAQPQQPDQRPSQPEYAKAKVLEVEIYDFAEAGEQDTVSRSTQIVTLKMLSGKFRGKIVDVDHMSKGMMGGDMVLKINDKVLVFVDENPSEAESPDGEPIFHVADYVRTVPIFWLAFLYCLLLVVIGGMKGLKSLISLIITIAMLFFVMFPLVLMGFNPLLVSILIVGIVSFIVFRIIGGNSIKSKSAAIGTFVGVAMAGILATIFGNIVHLTGLSSQEAKILLYAMDLKINFQGLLFGSILIGALGAIMDVGMSIASAVDEIKKHKLDADFKVLFEAGMNVGRDVMGTMSNTLILAYTGSALPLLLLFIANHVPVSKIINLELIAAEIVRALAGSTGLILCIPITAAVAAFMHSNELKK